MFFYPLNRFLLSLLNEYHHYYGMTEGSFEEIFKLKSRKEFAVNPVSLTGYLIDRKFPSEDIRTYRSMARMCPAVVSKVLRGDISAEEAASQASKQAKVDAPIARSLFERMSARPEVEQKTIVHMVEPVQKPEPPVEPAKKKPEPEAILAEKKTIVSKEAPAHTDTRFKGVKETTVDGMKFELSLREARLKRCDRANPGASIPKTVNGLPVTIIGKEAYKGCEPIAFSVTLPETVVKIEEKAFEGCHRLESIGLPNALKEIGDRAFSRCWSLKTDIPDSVAEIGKGAFECCTTLESIAFPRIAAVSDLCFSHCVHLKSIDIPDTVTTIGDYAFEHCIELVPKNLPSSLASIGKGAFRGCKKAKSIEIPDSVTEIGAEAFCSCTDLKNMKLPKNLSKIEDRLCFGCENLESLKIPDSVRSIGSFAFYKCNLSSSMLPRMLERIEDGAFYDCFNYTYVYIPESVTYVGKKSFPRGCKVFESESRRRKHTYYRRGD